MGLLSGGIMMVAFVVAAATYQWAKSTWRMPVIVNVPGALLAFNVIPTFFGWLLHDLFDGYVYMSAPEVPWYTSVGYLGLTLFWYLSMGLLLKKGRTGKVVTLEANQ
jgi:hypothetical protein